MSESDVSAPRPVSTGELSHDDLSKADSRGKDSASTQDPMGEYLLASDMDALRAVNELYDRYIKDLEDVGNTSNVTVKRSFEDYMGAIDSQFTAKVDHQMCKKLRGVFREFDENMENLEKKFADPADAARVPQKKQKSTIQPPGGKTDLANPKSSWNDIFITEELKYDFCYFYKVLVRIWFGEHHKKSELVEMQPCKIIILRSLIKRKFGEEIDLRWIY